ncbi:hypothetical protein ACUYVZ_000912 [Campylobacter jejuni]|uniref:hypothetical protein n=1 Tax=Campylobacter jejuni TaxID=197 RepID=UPI0023DF4794|nr:hypothetical protein [Campylobacter jejuni]
MKKGSGIILYNGTVEGKSANGSLTINGNFTADKTLFATYGNFVKVKWSCKSYKFKFWTYETLLYRLRSK